MSITGKTRQFIDGVPVEALTDITVTQTSVVVDSLGIYSSIDYNNNYTKSQLLSSDNSVEIIYIINAETSQVNGADQHTLTIMRGQENTIAKSYASSIKIIPIFNTSDINNFLPKTESLNTKFILKDGSTPFGYTPTKDNHVVTKKYLEGRTIKTTLTDEKTLDSIVIAESILLETTVDDQSVYGITANALPANFNFSNIIPEGYHITSIRKFQEIIISGGDNYIPKRIQIKLAITVGKPVYTIV